MLKRILSKKSIHDHHISHLNRTLDALDLTLMGIGAIIGAGVFVLTGIAAATKAGPAIVISYVIAGLASLFAALAYAELAASIGGAGSAYSYAYTGFGELVAWLIGWNLLLEYAMSVTAVSIGWASYVNDFFTAIQLPLPLALTKNPFDGGVVNLLAIFIILFITAMLSIGIRESARFNAIVVFIKLLTIAVFISVAVLHVNPHNWTPFFPFGWDGVVSGASLVFFAYIGFDALSTTVEETINPQRNVPIGIIASLVICTALYIVVSGLLTSIASYQTLNVSSPVSNTLLHLGHQFAAAVVSAGAIAGLTTVILVMFYGLSRVTLAIALDGLLPIALAKIHYQTRTPVRIILLMGCVTSVIAGFTPIEYVAELVNIGTLTAFTFVCAGVLILRKTHKDMERPFQAPLYPITPILGIGFCLYLMIYLPGITWIRFIIWTVIGIIIYFFYGIKKSVLRKTTTLDAS